MKRKYLSIFTLTLLIVMLISGCTAPTATQAAPTPKLATATLTPKPVGLFTLTSPVFKDGEALVDKYIYSMGSQCGGENYSPPLAWTDAPANTRSFALTLVDPDGGNWVHWVQFNIPADLTSLEETVKGPKVGVMGRNDFSAVEYSGPCPPGGTHHYIFTLYALDTLLDLKEATNLATLLHAMEGHILGQAHLTGLRSR